MQKTPFNLIYILKKYVVPSQVMPLGFYRKWFAIKHSHIFFFFTASINRTKIRQYVKKYEFLNVNRLTRHPVHLYIIETILEVLKSIH